MNDTKKRFDERFGKDPKVTPTLFPYKEDLLSFIESECQGREKELFAKVESGLEDYFQSTYPIPDPRVISGYLREALTNQSITKI